MFAIAAIKHLIQSCHLSNYLSKMIENGDIVNIDNIKYTTPNKTLHNIQNLELIIESIKDIIHSTEKIVELDLVKDLINVKFNLNYDKYFSAAMILTKQDFLNAIK